MKLIIRSKPNVRSRLKFTWLLVKTACAMLVYGDAGIRFDDGDWTPVDHETQGEKRQKFK